MLKQPMTTIRILALALMYAGMAQPASAQNDQCFPQTNQCINGRFRQFWEQNGGLAVFGYPITPARQENNRDTGQSYLTQWFERNRFELHIENPVPYDVLLGRLGDDRLIQTGRDWRQEGREIGPQAGCLWFEQTGHNVCNQDSSRGFRQYWETHGLHDPQLDAYQRSLALFGLPLTQPRAETNSSGDTVLTQWFERARFEWHPGNPTEYKVLLGRLGDEIAKATNDGEAQHGRIVYTSSRDMTTSRDLYIMNADGTEQRRITTGDVPPVERAEYLVSPKGDRLAYRAGLTLYVVNTDGTGQRTIATANPSSSDLVELFSPAWSPDGEYVAFVWDGDVYVSKADGSAPLRVTRSEDVITPGCLSWARNGYIGFLKAGRATNKIWVVRSDGSDARQVGWGLCPALSPAGDRIAYRNGSDLAIVNLDGSNDHPLTTGRNVVRPIWSPDGTRLLTADSGDIIVVNAEGGTITSLTRDTAMDSHPSWSPDGRFIVFASLRDQRHHIFVTRADGANQRALPTPMDANNPQWTR